MFLTQLLDYSRVVTGEVELSRATMNLRFFSQTSIHLSRCTIITLISQMYSLRLSGEKKDEYLGEREYAIVRL